MLINLVAWIYISLVCLALGNMVLSVIDKSAGKDTFLRIHPSLICLVGLSATGTLALALSLLTPLNWKAHCLLILPVFGYFLKKDNRHTIRMQLDMLKDHFSAMGYCFLAVCILMTLVLSSYTIDHPDTSFYHAKSILLFEGYKPIPGIANTRPELGFQSLWFAALAVFKIHATAFYNVLFLNGAVLCWYFIFIIGKIEGEIRNKKEKSSDKKNIGWAWLLLLAYSLASWTQTRLTASSASPDFIVTLYTWAAIYVFFHSGDEKSNREIYGVLVFICCLTALLIKISSIVLLSLAIISVIRTSRSRTARSPVVYAVMYPVAAVIMLIPLFARNLITSGYLFYPSPLLDIFHADWKPKLSAIHLFEDYISAYARYPVNMIEPELQLQLQKTFNQWIPEWWSHLNIADRVLIAVIAFGILAGIFQTLRRGLLLLAQTREKELQPRLTDGKYPITLFLITMAGFLLWFLKAPSPRFGTGFMIPLTYFLYFRSDLRRINPSKFFQLTQTSAVYRFHPYRIICWVLLLAVAGYDVYRFTTFFKPSEIIFPSGIAKAAYDPLEGKELKINLLSHEIEKQEARDHSSTGDSLNNFLLLGRTIDEGFKPAD